MDKLTLETLAERLTALERKVAALGGSVVPPARDWRSVVGLSEETEFSRQWQAEMEAMRAAERAEVMSPQ
ncbi:MAG TPA: hypothetical protein VH120_02680 [Gemmataceae bacterium]|jgi:hypothetical protein|nr:hypothetical protein [Gemmataceae bacterium]